MRTFEAIEVLRARARRFTRVLNGIAALSTLAAAGALLVTLIPVLPTRLAAALSVSLSIAVVPWAFARAIRLLLVNRRADWIDELVRTEGLSRAEVEAAFTLDSW